MTTSDNPEDRWPRTTAHPGRYVGRNGVQHDHLAGDCLRNGGNIARQRGARYRNFGAGAEALRPIAGQFAFAMFAVEIIGTGLLAFLVLAGSAAYAVTEMAGFAGSLDAKPLSAKLFYATIAATTLAGASLNVVGY